MPEIRSRRRDAVANRARIVEAARAVFARQGLAADMRTIADEAGVGVGTLYRHFPTREHLVREITGLSLSGLVAARLDPALPAADALQQYFIAALIELAKSSAAVALLAGSAASDAPLRQCVHHLSSIGKNAVDRSRTDQSLDPDLTPADVAYLFLALARIVQLLPRPTPRQVEHYVELALRGLRRRPTTTATTGP